MGFEVTGSEKRSARFDLPLWADQKEQGDDQGVSDVPVEKR
jgi:hypothetical protein